MRKRLHNGALLVFCELMNGKRVTSVPTVKRKRRPVRGSTTSEVERVGKLKDIPLADYIIKLAPADSMDIAE